MAQCSPSPDDVAGLSVSSILNASICTLHYLYNTIVGYSLRGQECLDERSATADFLCTCANRRSHQHLAHDVTQKGTLIVQAHMFIHFRGRNGTAFSRCIRL